MSTPVKRGLYGKLAGDTTLTNLLATPPSGYSKSIYFNQAPQGAQHPFVVFNKQAGTPTYAFATTPAFDNDVWLVKALDRNTTADAAEAIAARVDALLTDGALSISGKALAYLRRQSDIQFSEVTDGVIYQHVGCLFRLVTT